MRINHSVSKLRIALAIIFSAMSILFALWSGMSYKYVVVLPIVVVLACFISIDLYNEIISMISVAVVPAFMTIILQLETGSVIDDLEIKLIIINWLLVAGISVIVILFTKKVKNVHIICCSIVFLFGFVDALVIAFRGNQISINDIRSIRTALSVVGNYQFNLNPMFIFAIILFASFFCFILQSKFVTVKAKNKMFVLIPYVIITCVLVTANIDRYSVATWGNQGCTKNGVLFELVLEIKYSKIKEPVGYSLEEAGNIASAYAVEARKYRGGVLQI